MSKVWYVGISGPARHGKDTFAGYLQDYLEDAGDWTLAVCASLAEPIKEGLFSLVWPFMDENGDGHASWRFREACDKRKEEEIESLGCSLRYLLQTLGTDWGRNMIKEDFWMEHLKRRLAWVEKTKGARTRIVIIPDIRFDNEANEVDYLIKVERPGIETGVRNHVSEAGVGRQPDVHVLNVGDLDELRQMADAVGKEILNQMEEQARGAA